MNLNYNMLMEKIELVKSKFLRGMFDQNTYVLSNKNEVIIIDAGAELEDIKTIVNGKKVLGILMTHLHFDHFWNLDKYFNEFDCPVYIYENNEIKFLDKELNGSNIIRLDIQKNIPKNRIKYYAKKLKIGQFEFEIFETPGHCKDCVCIKWNKYLFTGDTIFSDAIGRTDLKDSSNEEMKRSLEVIKNIDFDIALPGHYESATRNQILKTISFFI